MKRENTGKTKVLRDKMFELEDLEIQKQFSEEVDSLLKQGIPVTYRETTLDNALVREYPDGSRIFIENDKGRIVEAGPAPRCR